MSRHHAQAGDYRGALEKSGAAKLCRYRPETGANRGPCANLGDAAGPIDLQAHHVIELADVPKRDKQWVVWACPLHNRMLADEAKAKRKAPATGRTKMTTTSTTGGRARAPRQATTARAPEPKRGTRTRLLLGSAFIAAAAAWWFQLLDRAITLTAWAAVAALAFLAVRALRARGRARCDALAVGIAQALQCVPHEVRVKPRGLRAWRGRRLVRARVSYPADVDDAPGAKPMVAVEAHLMGKLGMALKFTHAPWDNHFTYKPGQYTPPAPAEPEAAPPTPEQARAQGKLTAAMESVAKKSKGDWTGTLLSHDAIGPLRVEVRWPPDFDAARDEAQADLLRTVNMALPGRWKAEAWNGEDRILTLARRPNMPTRVEHVASFDPQDKVLTSLAMAVNEDHEAACWNQKLQPHMLVAGETGSGKTVLLRTLLTRAVVKGFEARVCDPKRTEFAGFRGWPGVSVVATQIEDIIAVVEHTYHEMDQRNTIIEATRAPGYKGRKITPADFAPILLIMDEAREFIDRANALWRASGNRGTEHPVIEMFRSITRIGRTARIHLVTGIQRPDAKVFGGEARDQYGARASLGALSMDGARMMYGSSAHGRDVPDEIKGRATADLGFGPQEIQVPWTPDPGDRDGDNTARDWELLAELRAAAERGQVNRRPHVNVETTLAEVQPYLAGLPHTVHDDAPAAPARRAITARPAPKPRDLGTIPISALAIAIQKGEPRWVIEEGEAVQVVAVEPDPISRDHEVLTFRDARGGERQVSFPANGRFELADPPVK